MTIIVNRIVSFLDGHVTFLSSSMISVTKVLFTVGFGCIRNIVTQISI